MRTSFAIALFALLSIILSSTASATGLGPAPAGTAIAEYNVATGEIIVSINDVINWYVESSSDSMTGPDSGIPPLPEAGGGVSSNDMRIGEATFGVSMTYTDINLGQVAQSNLPAGDLNIFWNPFPLVVGQPLESQPVVYVNQIPEPTSLVLALLGISCAGRRRYPRT